MKRRGAFQSFQKGQVLTETHTQPSGKGLRGSEEVGEGAVRASVASAPLQVLGIPVAGRNQPFA